MRHNWIPFENHTKDMVVIALARGRPATTEAIGLMAVESENGAIYSGCAAPSGVIREFSP